MEAKEFQEHMERFSTELVGKIKERNDALQAQVSELKGWYETLKSQGVPKEDAEKMVANALRPVLAQLADFEARLTAPGAAKQTVTFELAGDRILETKEWKEWNGGAARRGKSGVSFNFRADKDPERKDHDIVGSLWDNHPLYGPPERKTTITSTAIGSSTPGILVPERLPAIAFEGVRRMRVRDMLRRIPVTTNAVEWVKTNTITHAASPQVEGSNKDESAYTFVIDSVPIRTLAHWIPATRQVLDDWGLLQEAVNFELLKGLADLEDSELLAGAGTGVHLSGLITEATSYNTGLNVSGDTRIDKLNHALLQLELLERQASGIVLNPTDWRTITLIKNDIGGANTGQYILDGGPAGIAPLRIWGVPVALTTAMTAGQFLVGDFVEGAVVLDRMASRIDVSTEHDDYFIKNMVAIRAEERIGLVVRRADYFVAGSF